MFIFISLIFCQIIFSVNCYNCVIDARRDLHDLAPLIFNSKTLNFLYPKNGQNFVYLNSGESISLACLGDKNHFNISTPYELNKAIATCYNQNIFTFSEKKIKLPLNEIKCIYHPKSIVKSNYKPEIQLPGCKNNLYTIGFQNGNQFKKIIEFCFNRAMQQSVMSYANIYPFLVSSQRRPNQSPRFNTTLCNPAIEKSYTKFQQYKTFVRLLGLNSANKYVTNTSYLQRGHLMARADFFYQSQQAATYYHANAVPMWSTINAGNWALLEIDVRKLSRNIGQQLQVWTGGIDVLKLQNDEMVPSEIYLMDSSVPVPRLLFKIIYHKISKRAVVIVTINNPYFINLISQDIICDDVIERIQWITWNTKDVTKGFTYACTYDQFKKRYKNVPEINVDDLLSKT